MGVGSWELGVGESLRQFENLKAWQESQNLAVAIYKITKNFPDDEKFGLTNQIKRASSSVSANIAEGFGRSSAKDKLHFYTIAYGSLLETKNFLYLAQKLGFIADHELEKLIEKIVICQKLLNGLLASTRKRL